MLLNWEKPLNLTPLTNWKPKKWQIKIVSGPNKPSIFFSPFCIRLLGLVSDLVFYICTEVNDVLEVTEQATEQTGRLATIINIFN